MNYTQEQLKAAFDAVCDKKDWKSPIKAFIREEEQEITAAAIEHFTATLAYFYEANNCGTRVPGWYYVYAPGYRQGPAGDH